MQTSDNRAPGGLTATQLRLRIRLATQLGFQDDVDYWTKQLEDLEATQ